MTMRVGAMKHVKKDPTSCCLWGFVVAVLLLLIFAQRAVLAVCWLVADVVVARVQSIAVDDIAVDKAINALSVT